jgi:hypothetical protein
VPNTPRPFFSNRANRQAVAYAIDRTAITRVVGAYGGKPNDPILPPGIPGYRDVTIFPYTPNVEKAKQLLAGRTGKVVLYTPNDPNRRMEQAALLRGDARAAAYARLDRDITREAPFVVTGNSTTREFISANVRCPMTSAPWGGLNLLMLCPSG